MVRKFIEKINNIIQWTKKFHFFHISLVLPFLFSALFFLFGVICEKSINILDLCEILYCFLLFCFVTISIILQIIFFLIYKKTHKKFYVSKKLLSNKLYDILYIISILFFIFFISDCLIILLILIIIS